MRPACPTANTVPPSMAGRAASLMAVNDEAVRVRANESDHRTLPSLIRKATMSPLGNGTTTTSPSMAGLALERMLARSALPRKFHNSEPSAPDKQKTAPSVVTTKTRSPADVGEERTGAPTGF